MIVWSLIIEVLIIICWYKLIIKKEVFQRKIIRRSLKLFMLHKKIILYSMLSLVEYSDEGKEKILYIKKHIYNILSQFIILSIYIILEPFILTVLFINVKLGFLAFIIYSFFGLALLINKLKEKTQLIITYLISYIDNVLLPIESNPDIIFNYVTIMKAC